MQLFAGSRGYRGRLVRFAPRRLGVTLRNKLTDLYRSLPVANYDPEIRHVRLAPNASYSPWLTDRPFRAVYEAIESHTMVDEYRCYLLWTLAKQVAELPGAALEVGVWRGGTGCLVAACFAERRVKKPVYLCDTFHGVVKGGDQDTKYRGGEHADTTRSTVEALAQRLQVPDVHILEGIFPEETGHLLERSRFCFCHIDVDTYASAKGVAEWVWDRMEVGGVVVFDDYGFAHCEGVTRAVNEIDRDHDYRFIYNLSGQGIFVKTG